MNLFHCAALVISAAPVAVVAAPAAQKPSVAVLPLAAKGVDQNVVDLLLTSLVATLRKSEAFGRVVSTTELETLVGYERTRQLADCTGTSCMTEMAGALGVDRVITGQVGKVGGSYLFSISMLDTKEAVTLASVAERFKGDSAEPLLDAVEPVTRKLLNQAHMANSLLGQPATPVAPSVAPARPPEGDRAAAAAPVTRKPPAPPPPPPVQEKETTSQMLGWSLAGGGAAALVASLLLGVPVAVAAYFGVGLAVRLLVVRQPFAGDVSGGVAAAPVLFLGGVAGLASLAAIIAGTYLVLS